MTWILSKLEQKFLECQGGGCYLPQEEINFDKVKSMLAIADECINAINELKPKKGRFNILYKLSYDALHMLAEVLLIFNRVKSSNHKCLFAYLCYNYKGYDWVFFERIRTKRNGMQYYGEGISYEDWKEISFQAEFYISELKKNIFRKL